MHGFPPTHAPRFASATVVAAILLSFAALCAAQSTSHPTAQTTFQSIVAKADAARDAEQLDDAILLYRKALALRPSWTEGWWSLGTIDYDSDRYAEGAQAFQHVAAAKPTDGTTHLMFGLCLYELGQNAEAAKHFSLARKFGIQDSNEMEPVLLYHESMIELREGHFETANGSLHRLARLGTRGEEFYLACGMSVLLMLPRDLPAEGTAARAVVERIGQAEAADSIETHNTARDLYARVVRAAPDFPNIHLAFGRFLVGIQEPDMALAEFQEELKRNPDSVRAKLEIAAIDYRSNSSAGIPYAEEAVKASPSYPFAHYLLGVLYLDTNDAGRAIPELELARKMVPDEPQFAFALANAYTKTHRKTEAAAARADFVRLEDKQKSQQQGGPTYYDSGQLTGLAIGSRDAVQDSHP